MADFNITITNSINLFGPAPSNKWNAYNWNAFLWGEGTTDLAVSTLKVIGNSITPDSTIYKSPLRVIANSLSIDGDMHSQSLEDGAGYNYVFPDRTTEGEDRATNTWTNQSNQSTTWQTATAASSTWS